MKRTFFEIALVGIVVWLAWTLLTGDQPPRNAHNICDIFAEKKHWYSAAKKASKKWNVPITVPMAMMFQESSFRQNATPPMRTLFWIIPIGRKSSAYGFSQALDLTWDDYKTETNNLLASRSSFSDSIDFMGWFINKTNKINKISRFNAQHQYLNYHEGWGAYKRRSYRKKAWLRKTAKKVKWRANTYASQYKGCKGKLDRG
ncbi:MAG: transglycosylase SLT domain-containing protein [Cocleimonas sp.]|nr:transglycosylase SLT domain-containing protein [Cocleimonas sp.]